MGGRGGKEFSLIAVFAVHVANFCLWKEVPVMDSRWRWSWLLVVWLTANIAAHERPPFEVRGVNERYELVVPVVNAELTIDGKLDEPIWQKAAKAEGFRQARPLLGQPASQPTTVLVLATAEKLFFAFRCGVKGKDAIRAYETRYDASMPNDERVTVLLDTLHTHDRVYRFTVNARGTRHDERFGNERWDARWDAAVQVGETEWMVEIAIPYAILTYDPNQTTWGVNFARYISETQEQVVWAFNPDRFFDMRYMPHLVGMPLPKGRGENNANQKRLLLETFAVADYQMEGGDKGIGNNYGIDGEWTPRPNMALRFVMKPDFSEVEEAFETIDVSYVEQFVPDRREFFVQGSEFFSEVAVAGEIWRRSSDPTLFFSRRVERFDSGLKFTGALGDTRLGILTTHRFDEGEHNLIINIAQAFGVQGRAFLGYVDAMHPDAFSRGFLIGGEWRFGPKNRMSLRGSYARNFASEKDRDGGAGSFRFNYSDERWFFSLGWTAFGPGFRPLLGFTPRTDFKRWSLFTHRAFRPSRPSFYREAGFFARWSKGETFNDAFFESGYGFGFNLTLRDQTSFWVGWDRSRHAEYHIRSEPFNDRSFNVGIEFGGDRPLRGEIGYAIGRAFDGRYRQPSFSLSWDKPDGSWRVRLSLSRRYQTLPEGRQNISQNEISLTRILSREKWLVLRYFHRRGDFTIKNFAVSFRLKRESGEEIFLIWGDPRARQTKNRFIVKWIFPFRF